MAKNCLNNQPALGTGNAGTTNCNNCDNQNSYYLTIIGESTYTVKNSSPLVYEMIDDGVEPMSHTVTYDGKVGVEFTGNVKRLILGLGTYENCFIGVALNGFVIASSLIGIHTKKATDQYDVSLQAVPFDVVIGDVITIVAGTSDASAEHLHQVLNHNMRVMYVEAS
jgi:hypothetical protein